MKKIFTVIALSLAFSFVFAASYKNNTYQKLAEEYAVKAQKAMDAGEYDLSIEYALKAEENAALSQAYIEKMTLKIKAEDSIVLAKNRIDYVKSFRGDAVYPLAFSDAMNYLQQAEASFANEDFILAGTNASQVLDVLADLKEVTPLPKYYVVTPWAESKDCFWNISGRPYVYNNPTLWENLYQANKNQLPQPKNPNLIEPGMKMEIPSISGEYRDGVYSPEVTYETFNAK